MSEVFLWVLHGIGGVMLGWGVRGLWIVIKRRRPPAMSSEVKRYDSFQIDPVTGKSGNVTFVLATDYAALEAERDALRQQRDKLAKVLEDVEREHGLIRRMKNCEIQRGRGSFGIAVMSDPPALEWQALDKELQQLIDDRRDALAAQHPDDAAVDRFAAAMKSKLAKSREKGRHGWQAASAAHLSSLLYRHMYKADPLDVANLAMMLHQNGQAIELPFEARGRHTTPQPAPAQDVGDDVEISRDQQGNYEAEAGYDYGR